MKPADPYAEWMPYHVCMGKEVSEFSLKQPFDISGELAMCGCGNNMAMQLCLSARVATLAITKMLASATK